MNADDVVSSVVSTAHRRV